MHPTLNPLEGAATRGDVGQEDGFLFDPESAARDEAEFIGVKGASVKMAGRPQDEARLPPVIFRMPNTAFGMSMGLAGHAIMWKGMRDADFVCGRVDVDIVDALNSICWHLATSATGMIAACYAYKIFASFPLVMAEYLNESRCHFFNCPNLIYVMLLIGLPAHLEIPNQTLRMLWVPAFCYQVLMTQHIYKAWMFSKRRNFTEAKPQFLLSTVGWFLLAILGQLCQVTEEWGIGLPQMCFGAGFILYIDIVIFIFGKLHENRGMKGSPAMFLLIAPPSVGAVSLDLLDGDASGFSEFGEMMLGWVFVLLMLLIRLGPILGRNPSVFGEYWAYVFPLAAATSATVRYASALNTRSAAVLAAVMITMAVSSLFLVLGRQTFHMYKCLKMEDEWGDPLFKIKEYSTRQLGRSLVQSTR